MVIEGEEITPVDPFPADVVDTTGAGDSFLGTLLAALAAGAGLKEAAGAASAVSASQRPPWGAGLLRGHRRSRAALRISAARRAERESRGRLAAAAEC